MNPTTDLDWLYFDIHGVVGLRVHSGSPAAPQLQTMMASFAVDREVPPDIVVGGELDLMVEAAVLNDVAYDATAVHFRHQHVQVVEQGTQFRVNGAGELLTAVLPLLDLVMVSRGAATIHAATVGFRGGAIALPGAESSARARTIAKLTRRPGFSFMGDEWGFVTADGRLLNYEKPMLVKPQDRSTYPHLFRGSRKPLVPVRVSTALGRLSTVVQPRIVKYPRLTDMSRRMGPEHRVVSAHQALPGVGVTEDAPLLMSVFVERYEGARTRVAERDTAWMAQRLLGSFNLEMPGFSREVFATLAATSHLPLGSFFAEKAAVLGGALTDVPGFVLQVPSVYDADIASDEIVNAVEGLLRTLVGEGKVPSGVTVA